MRVLASLCCLLACCLIESSVEAIPLLRRWRFGGLMLGEAMKPWRVVFSALFFFSMPIVQVVVPGHAPCQCRVTRHKALLTCRHASLGLASPCRPTITVVRIAPSLRVPPLSPGRPPSIHPSIIINPVDPVIASSSVPRSVVARKHPSPPPSPPSGEDPSTTTTGLCPISDPDAQN